MYPATIVVINDNELAFSEPFVGKQLHAISNTVVSSIIEGMAYAISGNHSEEKARFAVPLPACRVNDKIKSINHKRLNFICSGDISWFSTDNMLKVVLWHTRSRGLHPRGLL